MKWWCTSRESCGSSTAGKYPCDWMDLRTEGQLPSGRFDHHQSGDAVVVLHVARRGNPLVMHHLD